MKLNRQDVKCVGTIAYNGFFTFDIFRLSEVYGNNLYEIDYRLRMEYEYDDLDNFRRIGNEQQQRIHEIKAACVAKYFRLKETHPNLK